jgi:adenylosuccinate synthase
MANLAIIGAQWGDEGKGKITDALASQADVVVRFQGGNNAGHTIQFGTKKYAFHLLPSGSLHPEKLNLLANGMVIDPLALHHELRMLDRENIATQNIRVSHRAHVVMPFHSALDRAEEDRKIDKVGTTGKGIGPAYQDKVARRGIRMEDFLNDELFRQYLNEMVPTINRLLESETPYESEQIFETMVSARARLQDHVSDTAYLINQAVKEDKKILFEGAQGTLLCLDHGTYPYVTSSSPTAAAIPLNTGLAPKHLGNILGITKAYSTRVGEGPMVSEVIGPWADTVRTVGREYGTTTGRPRRIGHFDVFALKHAHQINGFSHLAITLLDVLKGMHPLTIVVGYRYQGQTLEAFPASARVLNQCEPITIELPGFDEDISDVKTYEALPLNARNYIEKISELVEVPIGMVSVGPDRTQTLIKEDIFA